MSDLRNKEAQFAEMIEKLTRTAREQKNTVSEEQLNDALKDLELDDSQVQMVKDYLAKKNIGIGVAPDPDDYLTDEETNYLQVYIESLKELPEATEGEKEGITISAMAGDRTSQKRLSEIYLPLVVDIAKIYAEQGVYIEDLIGEGNVALMRGVGMLDAVGEASEAESFLSRMIMDAMEDLIAENLDEDARGQKAVKLAQEVADKARELADDLRRSVTVEELMEETGWDRDKIMEALRVTGFNIEDIDTKGLE